MNQPLSTPAEVKARIESAPYREVVAYIEACLRKNPQQIPAADGPYVRVDMADFQHLDAATREQVVLAYRRAGWSKVEFELQDYFKLFY